MSLVLMTAVTSPQTISKKVITAPRLESRSRPWRAALAHLSVLPGIGKILRILSIHVRFIEHGWTGCAG
jgi:hypothetical protein